MNKLLMLLLLSSTLPVFAQKPTIDSNVYNIWPSVEKASISNNGSYASYIIKNVPMGKSTLVIKSCDGKWEKTIVDGEESIFSEDSKTAIFRNPDSELKLLKLGGTVFKSFSNVLSYEFSKKKSGAEFLLIRRTDNSVKQLIFYNLTNGVAKTFPFVENYFIDKISLNIILLVDSNTHSHNKLSQVLKALNVNDLQLRSIWHGDGFDGNLCFAQGGSKIAFLVKKPDNSQSCIYYDFNLDKYQGLFNDTLIRDGKMITSLERFSADGSCLFFKAIEKTVPSKDKNSKTVNVWSYQDNALRSFGMKNRSGHVFLYSYNLKTGKITCIDKEGDIFSKAIGNNRALVYNYDPNTDVNERFWNTAAEMKSYLLSLKTGERIYLDRIKGNNNDFGSLSPEENYVVFFDGTDYQCYDIRKNEYRNLTKGIKTNWFQFFASDRSLTTRGVLTWIKNDEAVLVYDRFDIWLLDPSGKNRARNITNGYGKRNNIVFTQIMSDFDRSPIGWNGEFILNSTNLDNKEKGFYRKNLKKNGDPELLSVGPYVYNMVGINYPEIQNLVPVKSRDKNTYVVGRMSAGKSFNYFVTSNFKEFYPLSNLNPQDRYNWYTTELHSWKSLNGEALHGILYKPENFDPNKKYPLIFSYYERQSDNLNVCLVPSYSKSNIDIPTYVSNGYLVFVPDITFKMGDPMQGTYDSIVSAVHYLSKFSFIDQKKLGIQGFSFGGIETNYLVANTNLFAAACAGSGLSDMVSAYGTISNRGESLQRSFEYGGQYRMDGPPWDFSERYIKNSPIFRANKVTTPLLMMHTTNDPGCPFPNAMEFFLALRRLGKKVWLLEYTDGRHTIHGKSAIDFDIRMRQFFDHYLKDIPAPIWMLSSSVDGKNNTEIELQLDTLGRRPGPGLTRL